MRTVPALLLLLVAGLALYLASAWREERGRQPADDAAPPPRASVAEPAPAGREPLGGGRLSPTTSAAGVPRRVAELNREALAALEAGALARAVELLERCRAEVPDEPVFTRNLAEALARLARSAYADLGTRAAALEHLERAVKLDPAREDLAALLSRWRRQSEVEADFWTDESEHFHLSYDGERTELLHRGQRTILDTLEEAYLAFGELFGQFPVGGGAPKIQVVVHRREAFGELTGLGHWAGGVYDGVVRLPLEDLEREGPELRRVLRHELVHAFVRSVGGRKVPGWLNEGLAQWLEESFDTDRAQRVRRARRSLVGQAPFALVRLEDSLAGWSDPAQIALAYSQSLALVDHVQRWYGERLLYEMVAGCAEGRSPAATFRSRTHVDLEEVQRDLFESIESER